MKKKLTQSQIKERQEKTKKIKSLLIRSLNIVCYCLSVLFVIMAIAIGAQSCSNKNKSETDSAAINPSNKIQLRNRNDINIDGYNYLYTLKWFDNSTATTEFFYFQDVLTELNVTDNYYGTTQPTTGFYRYYFDNPVYAIVDYENLQEYDFFAIWVDYFETSINVWRAYVSRIYLRYDASTQYVVLNASSVDRASVTYITYSNSKLLVSNSDNDNTLLNLLYNIEEITPISFTFNNQINYNATFGGNIEQPFLSNGNTTSIDIGWFLSGGKLWDSIKFVWIDATNSSFKLSDDSIYEVTASGYKYFLYMSYENSITSTSVMVNSRDSLSYTSGNALSYYVNNSSTWVSSNYQTITLINDISEINLTNLNKYNNTTAGGSITTGGNIGLQNGFTLVKTAFTSILPFLAIQVLPGLSIGLLLFIPLIVIIIILVFKVVKK